VRVDPCASAIGAVGIPRAVFSGSARNAFVQMDLFPRAYVAISSALLQRHGAANAASGRDRCFTTPVSGCFVPRCWVRGCVNSCAGSMRYSDREVAVFSSCSECLKMSKLSPLEKFDTVLFINEIDQLPAI